MSAFLEETVTVVNHWTDRLFSFTTTREQALRSSNEHFTMIGLRGDNGMPLLRAYGIVTTATRRHSASASRPWRDTWRPTSTTVPM